LDDRGDKVKGISIVRKQIVRRSMVLIRVVFSDGAMYSRRSAQLVGGG
jgi:hypothetical protein